MMQEVVAVASQAGPAPVPEQQGSAAAGNSSSSSGPAVAAATSGLSARTVGEALQRLGVEGAVGAVVKASVRAALGAAGSV
jgi:hypothetical protein